MIGVFFCPSTCSLYNCTWLTLTTGCILIEFGSSNSIVLVKMIPFTLYSPTNHLVSFSNFLPIICHFRFFVLSNTKSLTLYSSPLSHFLFVYFFIFSYIFPNATLASSWIFFIFFTNLSAASNFPLLLFSNPILGS